ncbi:MAG: FAD:protein FMN transferase [Burkholderiales bacterium]|nr:FAD:protein FMN transferase [Burkholderiales bacterium]MDE1926143.1 FAD:protein FMN transferase [Burkholderiales bacterium]MDE2502933.1 FAD:protein FMN transferase [Burkholderiales bacterium]
MAERRDRVHEFRAMGSPCLIRVAGPKVGAGAVQRAMGRAAAEVARIERKYSRYRGDSVVGRINAGAGRPERQAVDGETADLLRFADQLHRESGGLFDITSGVLRRAWDFKAGVCPAPAEVARLLPFVGWSKVEFDGRAIRLPEPGMELDFGGFGKEYAADRAATLLREAGLHHGYVNLGGDIRLLGPMPDGAPWRLGIAHPRRAGEVACAIELGHGALATSGDYERYFVSDGRRYCHILDPHSGWPVRCWQSASVIAPACLAAGALTTVAMLAQARAPAWLAAQGVAWILIDAQGHLHRGGPGPADEARDGVSRGPPASRHRP